MKIHEYQAKELLKTYGVAVPEGSVADDSVKARHAAQAINGKTVVKAQIHAGGRGKGGGIKLANSPEEAEKMAEQIMYFSHVIFHDAQFIPLQILSFFSFVAGYLGFEYLIRGDSVGFRTVGIF